MEDPHLRRLKIDLSELELAFEASSWEIAFFLDADTGEVIQVMENTFRDLENIYENYQDDEEDDENAEPIVLVDVLDEMDLADWERDMLLQADLVKNGTEERFRRIPVADSHEGYRDMEEFVETVQKSSVQMRLAQALRGKGVFRRFKDALLSFPDERERWFAFKNQRTHQRILDWLASEGIELI
jgi:hypothetical protein